MAGSGLKKQNNTTHQIGVNFLLKNPLPTTKNDKHNNKKPLQSNFHLQLNFLNRYNQHLHPVQIYFMFYTGSINIIPLNIRKINGEAAVALKNVQYRPTTTATARHPMEG